MSWVAAGIAGASIGGALISGDAAKSAANTQVQGAKAATNAEMQMFDKTQQNMSPWMNSGQMSLQQLMQGAGVGPKPLGPTPGVDYSKNLVQNVGGKSFLSNELQNDPYYRQAWDQLVKSEGGGNSEGINPQMLESQLKSQLAGGQNGPGYGSLTKPFSLQDFQESPAYQFNLSEGEKAINKAAAARGKYYAPGTLQDISKYSQGLASNEYQNAFSNYNTNMGNIWNRLSGLSGSGQNAAGNLGAMGTQVAGQVGNNLTGAANAGAAGIVGGANALNSGMSSAYNQYLTQQILQNSQRSSVPTYDPNFAQDAGMSLAQER